MNLNNLPQMALWQLHAQHQGRVGVIVCEDLNERVGNRLYPYLVRAGENVGERIIRLNNTPHTRVLGYVSTEAEVK